MTNEARERKKTIRELETLAAEVLELKTLRELRRPLVIEFCGSPKSGKSTTITSINQFLKRNGFTTKVLTERASICPVKNKKNPFFNLWTLTSALAEIIEHIDNKSADIIIADRGIFDALCWFEWLNKNGSIGAPYLDDDSYKVLEKFIHLEIWKDYIDLIYVFKVEPTTSIEREYANLLTDKRGSIMVEDVLAGFNKSIDTIYEKDKDNFREVVQIQTDTPETDKNPNEVSYQVTNNILRILQSFLIEKIGFTNNSIINKLRYGINSIEILNSINLQFDNRDKIEDSENLQIVPIAIITNKEKDRLLVVKKNTRRTSKDSPERDKLLTYIGGHIRKEDEKQSTIDTIRKALRREIQEEIEESIYINNNKSFLIYTPDNDKSRKHLAVCYVIETDLTDKKIKLSSDEFIMKTGKTKSGHLLGINELIKEKNNLESWSKEILKHIFNLDVNIKDKNLFTDKEL